MQKDLKPSLVFAVSIWCIALLVYVCISAVMIFRDKSDMFAAKATEITTSLDRRIAQNFAFVKSLEVFSTISGVESMKVFGSLVQHIMDACPRIHLIHLYELPKGDGLSHAALVASFPSATDVAAIPAVLPTVINQPRGMIRGFADPRFPGRYFTTTHIENGNAHYAIIMLLDVAEMIKPILQSGAPEVEWIIGSVPAILLNDEQDSFFSPWLRLERTIVPGLHKTASEDVTNFPEGTVFRISETVDLSELFNPLGLAAYCSLSAAAVAAAYYSLHQRRLSQRLRQSEEEALGRAARLEKENRLEHAARVNAIGELAAGIIHELAQPLTSLLSQSQASLKTLEENQTHVDFLKRAMDANVRDAKRAGRILGKIRDYIVNTVAVPEITTLNSAILEIVDILNLEIKQRNVSLVLCLAEPSPVANINRIELEQVIHNLVRNSIEALGTLEQPQKRITIQTIADHTANIIQVSDNGPGLSQDTLAQLFQPFFTTKNSGMGLGLSLSQRIVQRVGGLLTASNKDGAVFTITLPKVEPVPATEPHRMVIAVDAARDRQLEHAINHFTASKRFAG
ncbi:histidine kinase/DNA gyrase B/HSP90-like ATPase [Phyllobacterium myrsinacearum]|uniref:sensor histidine kinase n=1 Tax=Phyllobacterium myrsinacearum TaxID=28101 RepID=UPI0010296BF1|nr:ATP-binding protein [Phyllobacterium myrsinacearum]RZS77643.1 histidine kinase/DNA gyrase B/HSP90-like ATPase [Phyllobacterium myrsinacearum]